MVVLAPLLLASVTSSFFSTVQTNFDYDCLFAQKIDEERVATRQIQRGREHFVQLHEVYFVFLLFSNISCLEWHYSCYRQ
jgi:hypothetical protein